jgi:hypothetical protein
MSIAVELAELHDATLSNQRAPYFLTVGGDGRPHSVETDWRWVDDGLELSVGNRTLANARARAFVSLVWPPDELGGYSLIVDADVTHTEGTGAGDNLVRVRPTRAVLHRPATQPTNAGCAADCAPIYSPRADQVD